MNHPFAKGLSQAENFSNLKNNFKAFPFKKEKLLLNKVQLESSNQANLPTLAVMRQEISKIIPQVVGKLYVHTKNFLVRSSYYEPF